jgi:hypothetical protein
MGHCGVHTWRSEPIAGELGGDLSAVVESVGILPTWLVLGVLRKRVLFSF